MPEYSSGQERKIKQFISSYRCSICRRSFDRDHVRVAARHEQLWIVSVRCSLCRNQQVFWVAVKDTEAQSLLRDVSDAEERQFAEMDPVTADEVLDMHLFLSEFDGDFKALFTG